MKKITFKLFTILAFFTAVISNAQNVNIVNINSVAKAEFLTNNPTLTGGTVLNVEISYTDISVEADNLVIRFLTSTWAEVSGTIVTATTGAATGTMTLTLTVPSINPGLSAAKIQARGANGSGSFVNSVLYPFDIAQDDSVEVNCSVSITTIHGESVVDYVANNSNALDEGDILTIGVDYTAVKPDPNRGDVVDIRVRFRKNDYGEIPEAVTVSVPVTTLSTSQSTTVDITVPNLETTLNGVRLQALAYGYTGSADGQNFDYAGGQTFDIDSSTLSINDFNKSEINAFYSSSKNAIVLSEAIKGEYIIYNLMGQSISKGEITNEINVSNLKSGVYIFSTEVGSLKFVK